MSSGYVYRGTAIPALRGKYIFGDISTGNLWWADYKEMLAADDDDPKTEAAIHPLKIEWAKPGAATGDIYASMFPITEANLYHARGGDRFGASWHRCGDEGRSFRHTPSGSTQPEKSTIMSKSDRDDPCK